MKKKQISQVHTLRIHSHCLSLPCIYLTHLVCIYCTHLWITYCFLNLLQGLLVDPWQFDNHLNWRGRQLNVAERIIVLLRYIYLIWFKGNLHHETHPICLFRNVCDVLGDWMVAAVVSLFLREVRSCLPRWHQRGTLLLLTRLQWHLIDEKMSVVSNIKDNGQVFAVSSKNKKARSFLTHRFPAMFIVVEIRNPL